MHVASEKKWKPDWNCFVQPGQPTTKIPGLTKILKKLFYSEYSFKNATEGYALGHSNQEVKKRALADRKAKGGRGTGKVSGKKLQQTGMVMGGEVDKELLALTKELVDHPDSSMADVLAKLHPTLHFSADTVKLWVALDKLGLRPISSQTIVLSRRMNIATPLDLVCVRAQSGAIVNVQIKRGYSGYYEKHTRIPMSPPFTLFNDSPYMQHQLQILFEWLMMAECFTGPKDVVMEAMVLRVDNEGVSKYPMIPELKLLAPHAVMAMTNRKQILKERNKAKRAAKKILKTIESKMPPQLAPKPDKGVPFHGHSRPIKKKQQQQQQQQQKRSKKATPSKLASALIAIEE